MAASYNLEVVSPFLTKFYEAMQAKESFPMSKKIYTFISKGGLFR